MYLFALVSTLLFARVPFFAPVSTPLFVLVNMCHFS